MNNTIKEFVRAQRDSKYYYSYVKSINNLLYITKLNFYKLVQFLKTYMDLQGIKTLIVICLCTAQRWLYKLGYKYKDVHKNAFVDRHEQLDIVKDCKNFLKKMKELQSYLIIFKENKKKKPKIYLPDCAIGEDNYCQIIVITHNKCIFSANNRGQKTWT